MWLDAFEITWQIQCIFYLLSDSFAKVALSKSRLHCNWTLCIEFYSHSLNFFDFVIISFSGKLHLSKNSYLYKWNCLRTPELTELHPLVNKLLRHKGTLLEKTKNKTKIHPYLVAEVPFGFFTLVRQFTGESNLIQWALLDCFVHRFLYPFELFLKIFE